MQIGILNTIFRLTKLAIATCLWLVCSTVTSCSFYEEEAIRVEEQAELPHGHNIAIMAGHSFSTRTQIDPSDMKSVMWSKDDKIALWAIDESTSQFSFEARPLSLHYYNTEYNSAVFTGNVPEQTANSYTYIATYPLPTKRVGSSVTFSLPTTQSGYYDGTSDLIFARAVSEAALGDNALKNGNLVFNQLTHAIRIEIPKQRDWLGKTSKLQVTFPSAVVGDATLNINDENPTLNLSNTSRSIYVDFDKVISEAGYVWIFIAPTTIDGEVEFVGYDKDGIPSKAITTTLSQRELAAGHITPITLTIPEESYRKVVLTISENKLGEDIKSVTLTAPTGAYFEGDLSKITVPVNNDGSFEFSYSAARYDDAFRSGEIAVSFESEHAIVPRSPIVLTKEDKYLVNYRNYTIPYLFEEDFSGITGTDSYNGLGLITNGLPGIDSYWTEGRIFAFWDSTSIALKAYYLLGVTYYSYLSLELDGMTYLKPDAKVSLSIECNAEWKKNKIKSMKLKLYDNDNSDNSSSVTLSNRSDASQTNIPTKREFTLPNCSSNTIIVWQTDQGSGSGIKSGYDYVYIDNIKISIK